MLKSKGPKIWMTWDHLSSGPIQSWEFIFALVCPEPLPRKIMEEGKRESSLTIWSAQSTKGILSCHKGQESRSLKPRTMGIQLYIQSRLSPFILHVYLTSTWIKAILFHEKKRKKKRKLGFTYSNIWTRKEESPAQGLAGWKNRNMQLLPCCRCF